MAFIPIPNCAKVAVRGHIDGQEIINTLYFTNAGGFSPSELTSLAGAVSGWWISNVIPLLSTAYTMADVTATDQAVEGGAQSIDAAGSGTAGEETGVVLPNNAAFCLSFRTGFTGRSNRGRNYISGIPNEARTTVNTLNDEYVGALVTAYTALIAAVDPSTWVVASRFHNGAPRTSGVTNPVTTVLAVDNNIDSQRRRLVGRGS